MCFTESDGPDFLVSTPRRARKPHKCKECRRAIAVGDTYTRHTGVWDGRFESFAECRTCEWIIDKIYKHEIEEGCSAYEASPAFGELAELDLAEFDIAFFPIVAVTP